MIARPLAIAAVFLTGAGAYAAVSDAPGVEYRSPTEVAMVRAGGETGGPVLTTTEFRVLAARRDKAGEAEVHDSETDIFFVVDGRATIAIGGKVIGAHPTTPGETRGSAIEGGKDYVLEPGIVLTIPRGVPHWIRETTPGFRYNVVKVRAR